MTAELITTWLQQFGPQGATIAVIAYTLRKFCLWLFPLLADWGAQLVKAHVDRQTTMEECHKKLTESTVALHQDTKNMVDQLTAKLPTICRAECPLPTVVPMKKRQ